MTTIPLSRPIRVIDRDVAALTLREPTGKDLVRAGYPVRIHGGGAVEVDAGAMTKMIARLADVPADSIERLAAPDWNACMAVVMGFFGASTAPTSSTDTSSAPGSGAIN